MVAKLPDYCWQHVNGPSGERAGRKRRRSRKRQSADREGQDRTPQLADRVSLALTADDLRIIGEEICNETWQASVARRFTEKVGDRIWTDAISNWSAGTCRPLASLARELEKINARSKEAVEQAIDTCVEALRIPAPIRILLSPLTDKIILPWSDMLTELAHSLRILGVFLCASLGRDLGKCACMKALAGEGAGKEELKKSLAMLFTHVAN